MLYLLQLLLAWRLGAADYGLYSLGTMTVTVAVLVAGVGLYVGAMRYVAIHGMADSAERLKETVLDAGLIIAITSSIMGLLLNLSAGWLAELLNKPGLERVLKLLAFALPSLALARVLGAIANGLGKIKYRVLIEDLIPPAAMMISVLLLSLRRLGLLEAVTAYTLANVLAAAAGIFFVLRILPRQGRWTTSLAGAKALLLFSWPTMFVATLNFLVPRIDVFAVGYFLSSSKVGIYTAANTTTFILGMSLVSLNLAVSPAFASLYHNESMDELSKVYKEGTRWVFLLTLPIFLFLTVAAREVMGLFGKGFAEGDKVLVLLSVGQLVNILVGSAGYLLIMSGRPKLELANTALFTLLKLSLSLVMIPRWGLVGAALSTGISVALLNLTRLVEVYLLLGIHPYNLKYLKVVGAGLVSALMAFQLKAWGRLHLDPTPSALLYPSVMLVSYALILYILGIEPEDKRVAMGLLSRFRYALLRR